MRYIKLQEQIRGVGTTTEKNRVLVDAIRRNQDKAFYAFKRALHSSEQHHLGNLLKEPAQATLSQNVLRGSQPSQSNVMTHFPVQVTQSSPDVPFPMDQGR